MATTESVHAIRDAAGSDLTSRAVGTAGMGGSMSVTSLAGVFSTWPALPRGPRPTSSKSSPRTRRRVESTRLGWSVSVPYRVHPDFLGERRRRCYDCFGCRAKNDVVTFVREVDQLDAVGAVAGEPGRYRVAGHRPGRVRRAQALCDATPRTPGTRAWAWPPAGTGCRARSGTRVLFCIVGPRRPGGLGRSDPAGTDTPRSRRAPPRRVGAARSLRRGRSTGLSLRAEGNLTRAFLARSAPVSTSPFLQRACHHREPDGGAHDAPTTPWRGCPNRNSGRRSADAPPC